MSKRFGRAALAAAAAVSVLCGCTATGTEIVRAPFISPVVVPAPDVFRMNVAVKNFSASDTSPDLWLRVYSEYQPQQHQPGEPPCSHSEYLHVGSLAPGKSWAQTDYRIDRASQCECRKDACSGHVWLSLHLAPEYAKPVGGPNTALHVNWAASGDLAAMTVSEF